MLSNYLTTAFRNLLRNKVYSLITIAGLGLGLACVFLIIYYVKTELAYDRHHAYAEDIYRIVWHTDNPQTRTPHPMAQAMVADFEEVVSAVSITPLWGVGLTRETFSFHNPEKDIRFDESNVIAVNTTFFDVFTIPMIAGNPETVLKNTGGLLISASMAKKYFGDEDPMGKKLTVNHEENLVEVLGVFKDFPATSHFKADFLVSYLREKSFEDTESQYYTWNDFGHYNYIRLKPGADAKALEARMLEWVGQKYITTSAQEIKELTAQNYGFRLQRLTDIHLHSHIRWELEPNGYIGYVYIMSAAAFLILIIGCVNFINLTTAQSVQRVREIGVRKSLGADRRQLAFQFTGESLVVSLLATVVAGILIEMSGPWFTSISGQQLNIDYRYFFLLLVGLGAITGIVSGLFPSMYLASLRPGEVLKGILPHQRKGLRPFFTVFQFFASMVLLSASLIIYLQLDFIQNQDLGFRQDEVIVIPIKDRDIINPRFDGLRNELLQVPGVRSVSAASNVPGHSFNQNPVFATQDPSNDVGASEALVDYDFFDVMGIELADGRFFTQENPADSEAFVINETLANNLYQGNAVGKELTWDYDAGMIKGTIIGVVKDFHFQSLHNPVDPLLFRLSSNFNYAVLQVSTESFEATIQDIEKTWRRIDNQFAFDYSFLREDLNQQYVEEQNMASVLAAFSVIAIAIACFGLLGIASLTFRQRTKEISVRKVLGASQSNLMILLIGDFSRTILLAILLAVPLVWWIMSQWLQYFTTRVNINILQFILPGILLMLVAWTTLIYLTWRVSSVNPAETLKSE